jgi:hypothetical protein
VSRPLCSRSSSFPGGDLLDKPVGEPLRVGEEAVRLSVAVWEVEQAAEGALRRLRK